MKVDVQGLINQLEDLKERIKALCSKIEELEDEGEEKIPLWEVDTYLDGFDAVNIAVACEGLKQAFLENMEKED